MSMTASFPVHTAFARRFIGKGAALHWQKRQGRWRPRYDP
jgi:hypothetical protein